MGWASAGDIFDPVAQALIDSDATFELKYATLTTLIDKLQDGDWDTEDESLDQFRHDSAVVAAFYTNDVGGELDDGIGYIKYDPTTHRWLLVCTVCGSFDLDNAPPTTEGHNDLLAVWAEHAHTNHGGDGEIPDWMLIGKTPEDAASEPDNEATEPVTEEDDR